MTGRRGVLHDPGMGDTAEHSVERAADQAAEQVADGSAGQPAEETAEQRRERRRVAWRGARRVLWRPGFHATVGERLARLTDAAPDVYDLDKPVDMYGDGIVETLEERVAALLGKEAAVFFPSGTMAQQVALRCWAGRTGSTTVAMHPLSHPEVHERHSLSTVGNLRIIHPTREPRMPSAEEVRDLEEPFGTLFLELPLREAGFVLPSWEELVAVTDAARERDAVVHMDGARLWECTTRLGHSLDEIADLADSVYVSFYKSLDGFGGAALAGPKTLVDEAKAWRHRYGGQILQQFPTALSALIGLEKELRGSRSTWPTRAWSPRRCVRGSPGPGCPGPGSTPRSRTPTSSRSGCRTTPTPSPTRGHCRPRRPRPACSRRSGSGVDPVWRSPRSRWPRRGWSGPRRTSARRSPTSWHGCRAEGRAVR